MDTRGFKKWMVRWDAHNAHALRREKRGSPYSGGFAMSFKKQLMIIAIGLICNAGLHGASSYGASWDHDDLTEGNDAGEHVEEAAPDMRWFEEALSDEAHQEKLMEFIDLVLHNDQVQARIAQFPAGETRVSNLAQLVNLEYQCRGTGLVGADGTSLVTAEQYALIDPIIHGRSHAQLFNAFYSIFKSRYNSCPAEFGAAGDVDEDPSR